MLEGGCLCGQVRYRAEGTPFHPTVCHCVDCRRAAAAPMVAWVSVPASGFRFVGAAPGRYRSSPGVERCFCAACGTPVTYRSLAFPDEVDVTLCSLDEPEGMVPVDQVWVGQRVGWVESVAGLRGFERRRGEG
jgi:hypothetical protein